MYRPRRLSLILHFLLIKFFYLCCNKFYIKYSVIIYLRVVFFCRHSKVVANPLLASPSASVEHLVLNCL